MLLKVADPSASIARVVEIKDALLSRVIVCKADSVRNGEMTRVRCGSFGYGQPA